MQLPARARPGARQRTQRPARRTGIPLNVHSCTGTDRPRWIPYPRIEYGRNARFPITLFGILHSLPVLPIIPPFPAELPNFHGEQNRAERRKTCFKHDKVKLKSARARGRRLHGRREGLKRRAAPRDMARKPHGGNQNFGRPGQRTR